MSMKRCVTSPSALNPKVEIEKEKSLFLKAFQVDDIRLEQVLHIQENFKA